jgi:hypothetical protein
LKIAIVMNEFAQTASIEGFFQHLSPSDFFSDDEHTNSCSVLRAREIYSVDRCQRRYSGSRMARIRCKCPQLFLAWFIPMIWERKLASEFSNWAQSRKSSNLWLGRALSSRTAACAVAPRIRGSWP